MNNDEQAELDFLRWIYNNIDFGPAHDDVMIMYLEDYTKETGKLVPKQYRRDDE